MPKSSSPRGFAWLAGVGYFVPAVIAFGACAWLDQPAAAGLLLLADTLTLLALAQWLVPRHVLAAPARRLGGALAFFILLGIFTAWIAALALYPVQWLHQAATLPAALALSVALLLAVSSLWRLWPTFVLVLLRPGALAAEVAGDGIRVALRRSRQLAARLTATQDVFFSHGLPVALSLLLAGCGALCLAGLGTALSGDSRLLLLVVYALLAPLCGLVLLNRTLDALLALRRLERTGRGELRVRALADAEDARDSLLAQLATPSELNATLLDAARAGQIDLALAALDRGADVNQLPAPGERDQRSLLILAAVGSDLRLLRALIAGGADVNRVHNGLTPLLAATRGSHQGRAEAVVMLLTNGANARLADAEDNTPLHHAALSAEPVVAALLLDAGADINALNRAGHTPLATACAMANWGLVRFLLEHGARLDLEQAQPVLAVAAGIGEDDVEGVKLLLKRRAKVDTIGPLGRSALMNAALHGHAAITRVLLDAGASVHLVDSHGVSALMEAARAGAEGVIALLGKRKPDPDALDSAGRSALMIACQSRRAGEGTVKQLLELGADVRLQLPDGKRALDFALANGRWDLVALIDPEHSLPSSVTDAGAVAAGDRVPSAHLLDALRFGHWPVVALFETAVRDWPVAQLATLYLELEAPAHAAARRWLLNHGLPAQAEVAPGQALPQLLLGRLPGSLAALQDLLDRGASLSGAGVLAQLLRRVTPIPGGGTPAIAAAGAETAAALQALALRLLESGVDHLAPDASGRSALMAATEHGLLALMQALLVRGADPNGRDAYGCVPLHAALTQPLALALPMLQALLRAGADPEAIAANNETPLGLALARAEPELTHWLCWSRWRLPGRALLPGDLAAAATLGDLDAVKRLLALGYPVDATDAQGASALLRAAGSGHADLVAFLLAAGADADLAAPSGVTALAAATNARRLAVVELLLAHGMAADQPLPGAVTPLMLAAAQAYPEIIERLLAHHAAVNAQDDRGRTPLHAAAQFAFHSHDSERCKRSLELLIAHGADLAACNREGQNALLLLLGAALPPGTRADQKLLLALMPILLGNRAAIDLQDTRGVSALHACAMHGLLLPLRALLAARAETGLRDVLGRTPAMLAQRLGFVDIAAELEVDPDAPPSAAQILRQRHDA